MVVTQERCSKLQEGFKRRYMQGGDGIIQGNRLLGIRNCDNVYISYYMIEN